MTNPSPKKNVAKDVLKDVRKDSAKLTKVLANLEKTFGKDMVRVGSEALTAKEVISTGHKLLDDAIGCGGIPIGIIAEFFGPEASGKGVTCMSIISEAQKIGKRCLWVDAEHQCNPNWMITNGIDLDAIDIIDVHRSAEDILEMVQQLADSGAYSVIVVDSLASLVPQIEMDKKVGDTQVGRMGAIMSTALRKLTPISAKNDCTVIFINQTREKIGVMFGNPETTPGGKALGFYASLRMRISKMSEKIQKNGEEIGVMSKVKIVKNRFGPPLKELMIPIYYVKFDPSPLEKFMDFARDIKAIRVSKGNYIVNKNVSDDLYKLADVLYSNDAFDELIEKIDKKQKEDKLKIEDKDIVAIIEKIKNKTFKYDEYVNMSGKSEEESLDDIESEAGEESDSED